MVFKCFATIFFMQMYRTLCRTKKDLLRLIENSRITNLAVLMPRGDRIELKEYIQSLDKKVSGFVSRLFAIEDFVLRISYSRDGSACRIEAANTAGEIRYNLYKWRGAAV